MLSSRATPASDKPSPLNLVITGLEPAKHKQLKRLAIDREKSVEHLLRKAVDDLLAKHNCA